jgi:Flp pilus assembly pilin Flp
MRMPARQGGQIMFEHMVLFILVVAALVTMGVYIKRGLSGKWREVGDSFGHGKQYEPGRTTRNGAIF